MRSFVSVVGLSLILSVSPVSAGTAKKVAKKPKRAPTPAAAPEKDPSESALASCKKHIESMLKESAETHFSNGDELRVQPADGGNFDVSGWVTSKTTSGDNKRADFVCHAARFGGGLWTTKTSLSYDR